MAKRPIKAIFVRNKPRNKFYNFYNFYFPPPQQQGRADDRPAGILGQIGLTVGLKKHPV
jgi:hypothetical protein